MYSNNLFIIYFILKEDAVHGNFISRSTSRKAIGGTRRNFTVEKSDNNNSAR